MDVNVAITHPGLRSLENRIKERLFGIDGLERPPEVSVRSGFDYGCVRVTAKILVPVELTIPFPMPSLKELMAAKTMDKAIARFHKFASECADQVFRGCAEAHRQVCAARDEFYRSHTNTGDDPKKGK